MSDTANTVTGNEAAEIDSALDALLADNDPKKMSYEDFRGAQYDHGLAWVYFDKGFGGLGVSPGLQRQVDVRIREAGASPMKAAKAKAMGMMVAAK